MSAFWVTVASRVLFMVAIMLATTAAIFARESLIIWAIASAVAWTLVDSYADHRSIVERRRKVLREVARGGSEQPRDQRR